MKKRYWLIACLALLFLFSFAMYACSENTEKLTYTVSFETGDGSAVPDQQVEEGGHATKPSNPTLENYIFVTWYKDQDFNEEFHFDTEVIVSDTVVYAKWEYEGVEAETYTVTFDAVGGEGGVMVDVAKGGKVTAPDEPVYDGHVFDGWYADAEYAQKFDFDTAISGDITVYAKWKAVFESEGLVFTETDVPDTLSVSAKAGHDFPYTVEIPEEIGGMAVVHVGDMSALTARVVVIPASVTEIGVSAFSGNNSIWVVDMSATSAVIDEYAFYSSSLYVIELGGATYIDTQAFAYSNLYAVDIPATVEYIGDLAFQSDMLMEVSFEGLFPELGIDPFGTGEREDDKLTVYATEAAWEALIENVEGETDEEKVTEATGLTHAYRYVLSDETIAQSKEGSGLYRGDDLLIYATMGTSALVFTDTVNLYGIYAYTHVNLVDVAGNEYVTALLDGDTRTIELLTPDANGEIKKDGVLYDYVGTALTYYVSDDVTAIAEGAGMYNYAVRFLIIGDEVESIGMFAFSFGYLFGLTVGANVEVIGDYAFFGQSYIMQAVFLGTTPPEIGTGAFCWASNIGIAPTFYYNSIYANYGIQPIISTPLSTVSDYDWDENWNIIYYDPECQTYIDAFNASLEGLEDGLIKDGNYEPVKYSKSEFEQITSRGLYTQGATYESVYGTISFTGSSAGYAYIALNDGANGYIYYSYLAGYSAEGDPKKVEIFTGYGEDGSVQSFIVYGTFSENGTFVLRGAEAGSYGELDSDILNLDGYGNAVYYRADGYTGTGTYTVNDSTVTVTGIDGISVVFIDADAKTVTFGGSTLTALGEEAGVYYDLAGRAIIKLDGKAYEDTDGDETLYYSGLLTITYGGETVTSGYVLEGNNLIFVLNGTSKTWTYSRTASNVITGYYGYYENYLKFNVIGSVHSNTYEGDVSLTLDGYFTAELGGESYSYYLFGGDANTVLLMGENDTIVVKLDDENLTYTIVDKQEAGKYYVSTSVNYSLYMDGEGNLLYYSSDEFKLGTYELDAETGEIKTWIDNSNDASVNGVLDLEAGTGYIVYFNYGSDSFMAISKQPFTTFKGQYSSSSYLYFTAFGYVLVDGSVENFVQYIYIYETGNTLFINTYGNAFVIVDIDSPLADGSVFTATYGGYEINFKVSVSDDGVYSIVNTVDYAAFEAVKTADNKDYYFCWLDEDKTYVGIYYLSYGYSYNLICGTAVWEDDSTFTVSGEIYGYTVSGYGTDSLYIETV